MGLNFLSRTFTSGFQYHRLPGKSQQRSPNDFNERFPGVKGEWGAADGDGEVARVPTRTETTMRSFLS